MSTISVKFDHDGLDGLPCVTVTFTHCDGSGTAIGMSLTDAETLAEMLVEVVRKVEELSVPDDL